MLCLGVNQAILFNIFLVKNELDEQLILKFINIYLSYL